MTTERKNSIDFPRIASILTVVTILLAGAFWTIRTVAEQSIEEKIGEVTKTIDSVSSDVAQLKIDNALVKADVLWIKDNQKELQADVKETLRIIREDRAVRSETHQ